MTARNDGTGQVRTAATGPSGDYTLTLLPAGTYTVSAELTGFKKAVRKAIEVNVGARLTLGFDLAVGDMSEAVEVTAEVPLVETTQVRPRAASSRRGRSRTCRCSTAPSRASSIIMPEARPVGNFDPTKTRIGNFAMSGGDGRQLDVNVDGGDNKDNVVGSLIQNFAYESIQEFQVSQHRWTAEAGRSVGGVVNVVSKSGTNELRGSFFGSYRGDSTRSTDFFEKQRQARTRPSRRPSSSARSTAARSAARSSRTAVLLRRAREVPRALGEHRHAGGASRSSARSPAPTSRRAIPTPYDDTLPTAKIDWHPAANHSLFARFAYQDQLVAQRPDPGAGDRRPQQRQHQHHDQLRLRGEPHLGARRATS